MHNSSGYLIPYIYLSALKKLKRLIEEQYQSAGIIKANTHLLERVTWGGGGTTPISNKFHDICTFLTVRDLQISNDKNTTDVLKSTIRGDLNINMCKSSLTRHLCRGTKWIVLFPMRVFTHRWCRCWRH